MSFLKSYDYRGSNKETCGQCRWHKRTGTDCYICENEDSENYAMETLHDETCDDFQAYGE
jgi:hypothetical protein